MNELSQCIWNILNATICFKHMYLYDAVRKRNDKKKTSLGYGFENDGFGPSG